MAKTFWPKTVHFRTAIQFYPSTLDLTSPGSFFKDRSLSFELPSIFMHPALIKTVSSSTDRSNWTVQYQDFSLILNDSFKNVHYKMLVEPTLTRIIRIVREREQNKNKNFVASREQEQTRTKNILNTENENRTRTKKICVYFYPWFRL